MATVTRREENQELARRFPADLVQAQLDDAIRVGFQADLVLQRKGSDIALCDVGSGVGLFPAVCAHAGIRVTMLKFDFSTSLFFVFLTGLMFSSSILRADQIADQIVEQVAELKSKPEGKRAILLVSQSELDALPLDTPVAWSTKPTSPEGPSIDIASPTNNGTYDGPFPIKVEFLPGPKGYDVDINSLKLEYKKAWGIDITDRVRDYITGTVIDVKESELPSGRHTVEIEIADIKHNVSRQIFTVTVK